MYRLPVILLIALLLSNALSAQEVYVRNKPFKGEVSGLGQDQRVNLEALATAVEMELKEVEGVLLIGEGEASQGEPGQLVVNGKSLTLSDGDEGKMVNLKAFSEAAGLRYNHNRELGTVDISIPPPESKTAGGGKWSALVGSPGIVNHINQNDPGKLQDLDAILVAGRLNMVYFYKPGETDKSFKKTLKAVDAFLEYPEVVLYKVNMGHYQSPLAKKYPGRIPRLMVFWGKRWVSTNNGHSIEFATDDPAGNMAEWRKRRNR